MSDAVLSSLAETSRAQGFSALALRLEDLGGPLGEELSAIASDLLPAGAGANLAVRAAQQLLIRPGKRLRALCVLLAARPAPGRRAVARERVRDLAIAAELVHAATLLHDDVLDEGTERRGVPTARMVFGNSASILGGDHLLIEALRRVERARFPELLAMLLEVIEQMIAAEAIQLEDRRQSIEARLERAELSARYLSVARGKTAALFRWGLIAGGRAAGLGPRELGALGRAGETAGIAFQLIDDLLDFAADPGETGKDSFSDLAGGKLTWPVLHAVQIDPGLAADLARGAPPTALARRIKESGAVEATRDEARRYGAEALEALSALPEGPARLALAGLVAAMLERSR
jgi:octaprenyl-diphosphate synthase